MSSTPHATVSWFKQSWNWLVVTVYVSIIAINALTLVIGRFYVYNLLSSSPYGIAFAFSPYDSSGTDGGLIGVALIFVSLSFFTYLIGEKQMVARVVYFALMPPLIGAVSLVIWNDCCNYAGSMPFGASGIDFAAVGFLVVFSLLDLRKILFQKLTGTGSSEQFVAKIIPAAVYSSVTCLLLVYVLILQPIYVSSPKYLSPVHEIAFVLAILAAISAENLTKIFRRPAPL